MQKTLFSKLDLELISAKKHLCGSEWSFKNICSPFSRIYLIIDGNGYVKHHNQLFRLTAGYLYLIPAHSISDYHCPRRLEQYYLHLKVSLFDNIHLFEILKPIYQVKVKDMNFAIKMMKQIIKANTQRDSGNEIEAKALSGYFVAQFLKKLKEEFSPGFVRGEEKIQNVVNYIEKYLSQKIELKDLAKIASLHPTYLSNYFKEVMKITPRQYQMKRRIEKAREMLWHADMSVEQIADEMGFSDAFHFSRTFKKHTGLSPSTYREQKSLEI